MIQASHPQEYKEGPDNLEALLARTKESFPMLLWLRDRDADANAGNIGVTSMTAAKRHVKADKSNAPMPSRRFPSSSHSEPGA